MIEATRGGSVGGDGFVTTSPRFLLPFASENTNDWTEEIFSVYYQVQIAVGLKKEASEEETKAQEVMQEIDDIIESGEGNFLDAVKNLFGDDNEDFDILVGDEEVVERIAEQLRAEEEND